jgi:predicted RNA-binding Zn-ribbon protein involved in translation (DUF1610 family)
MPIIYPKGQRCPDCGALLYEDYDQDQRMTTFECPNCGWIKDIPDEVK